MMNRYRSLALLIALILVADVEAAVVRRGVIPPVSATDVATFESSEAWTGAGTAADTTQVKKGSQGRSVTSSGTLVTSSFLYSSTRNFTAGKYFECWVYVPSPANTAGVALFLVRDTGATNYLGKTWSTGLQRGWNRLTVNAADLTSNGTGADLATIQQVRVGMQATGGTTTVTFDHCRNIQRKTRIFIEVDDGLITVYDIFAPKVEARGWKFSFYIATSKIGVDANYATWAQLNDLEDRGHTIGFHYHTNDDYGDGVGDDSFAGIMTDMTTGISTLSSNGISGQNGKYNFAVSQGRVTTDVDTLQRRIFLSGRRNTYPSSFGAFDLPQDPWAQWGFMPVSTTSLATFQGWVDGAITNQRAIALVFHCFNPALDANCVEPTMADSMLDYLKDKEKAGLLEVVPRSSMRDLYWERDPR